MYDLSEEYQNLWLHRDNGKLESDEEAEGISSIIIMKGRLYRFLSILEVEHDDNESIVQDPCTGQYSFWQTNLCNLPIP